jgi:hypothetical protein
MAHVDTKQLIQLGARAEVIRLSGALHDLLTTFPNFRALPELRFLVHRPVGRPARPEPTNGEIPEAKTRQTRKRKPKISAAGRAAISAAQKARWAAQKAAAGATTPKRKKD